MNDSRKVTGWERSYNEMKDSHKNEMEKIGKLSIRKQKKKDYDQLANKLEKEGTAGTYE